MWHGFEITTESNQRPSVSVYPRHQFRCKEQDGFPKYEKTDYKKLSLLLQKWKNPFFRGADRPEFA